MSVRSGFAAVAVIALLAPLTGWAQEPAPAPATPPDAAAPAAAVQASPNLTAQGSVFATLKASPDFTILTKALDDAQLSAVLSSTPGITLFAPTDAAFKALPPAELAALMQPANAPTLQKVLIYHLVNLRLDSAKMKGSKGPVPSVETSKLQLDGSGSVLKVNDADIIQTDVMATNGIIQVVDKVLIPTDITLPTAAAANSTPPDKG